MSAKKVFLAMVVLIVIVGGLGTGAFMYVYSQTQEFDQVFIEGVFVEDINLGGLTKQEGKSKVLEMLGKKDTGKTIVVQGQGKEWTIPLSKFEKEYNVDEVIEQAFKVGHEGNILERFQAFSNKEKGPIKFVLKSTYNKDVAKKIVQQYADEIYIAPEDATMIRKDKQFIITPEKPGLELDVQATANQVIALYEEQEEGKVEAVIVPIAPNKTAAYFEKVQTPIASFNTSYNNADLGRNVNLKVGAETINTFIGPGEIFALSDYLEPISSENGYKSSKVILNGKLVDGIGGGICQVASTLYNAVILTDLEIVQRQNHSMPVGYIPLGRDATYASNVIDFKFKNPTEYPIYIESYCEDNRLYVDLFGDKDLKIEHDVKFESVVVEVIPPPATKYEDDPTIPKGEKVVELAALDGRKVNLYKYLYKDGKLIDKVLENSSYYRPRGGLVRVGTKEVAPEEKETPDAETSEPKPNDQDNKIPEIPEGLDTLDDSSFMDLYEEQL